ncbi:MAG: NTP transferase domain-containing protein, partial [Planctomycetales bacterium]
MQTVILCGGMGTRFREETRSGPKAMAMIGGRPILWHILKLFARGGLQEFILCLGYRGDVIKNYFLNYEAMNRDCTVSLGTGEIQYHATHEEQNLQVTLTDTGADTMTGGRLQRAARYLKRETFLAAYGDGLADLDV